MSSSPSSSTLRKAKEKFSKCSACEEGQGVCAHLLVVVSVLLIFLTMPFSLCLVVKVVQVLHYLSSSSSLYLSSPSSLYMPSSFSLYLSSSPFWLSGHKSQEPGSFAEVGILLPTPELCNLGSNLWRHIASSLFYCNSCISYCIFLFQCPVDAQPTLTKPEIKCFVFVSCRVLVSSFLFVCSWKYHATPFLFLFSCGWPSSGYHPHSPFNIFNIS